MGDFDDHSRFEAVVLPHLDAAYDLARWLTRDPDAARDAVQEATFRALRFFASYRGGDARPWFLRIVRNAVISWRERHGRTEAIPFSALERDGGEAFVETLASPLGDPETLLAGREDKARIDGLLQRLPSDFREALVLRELEELSYKEIATITGVPIGTVMSRLARARRLLLAWAGELNEEGSDRGK